MVKNGKFEQSGNSSQVQHELKYQPKEVKEAPGVPKNRPKTVQIGREITGRAAVPLPGDTPAMVAFQDALTRHKAQIEVNNNQNIVLTRDEALLLDRIKVEYREDVIVKRRKAQELGEDPPEIPSNYYRQPSDNHNGVYLAQNSEAKKRENPETELSDNQRQVRQRTNSVNSREGLSQSHNNVQAQVELGPDQQRQEICMKRKYEKGDDFIMVLAHDSRIDTNEPGTYFKNEKTGMVLHIPDMPFYEKQMSGWANHAAKLTKLSRAAIYDLANESTANHGGWKFWKIVNAT